MHQAVDLKEIKSRDTLIVATMSGVTSYFQYRDEWIGYDYEMAENLAENLNLYLKVIVAKTENEMLKLLSEQKVDIICYNITESNELKEKYQFVFPQNESDQVLVQNRKSKQISDISELNGDTIFVKRNSVFHKRIYQINDEIAGNIKIHFKPDSISDDDMIDLVAENKIKFTVSKRDLAMLHKTYNRDLRCDLSISFEQKNGWLTRKESNKLTDAITKWNNSQNTIDLQHELRTKYWFRNPYFELKRITIPKGHLSPFDKYFKKYAPNINWDWKLLVAVAYNESRFNCYEVSWAGAAGVMQLMPRTAGNFGLNRHTIFEPESNIEAGVQYIKSLNLLFRQVEDIKERIKFILASYNSGPSHILDAMMLAQKHGKDPHIWFKNVEELLLKLNDPQFYNDESVKYGYFSGNTTAGYVRKTLNTYEKYKKIKYK